MNATAEATVPPEAERDGAEVASGYLEAVAVGARVAGMVVALAYLTGWIGGPLLAPAGGLALVTFGHALLLERDRSTLIGAAFAVLVLALAAGALRWSTLELTELRGIQAVLGPTVLVEKTSADLPVLAPVAAWAAAAASALTIAVWLRFPRGEVWFSLLPWAAEMIVAAVAVASVFWGPAATSFGSGDAGAIWTDVGRWALVTASVAVPAAGISFLLARVGRLWTTVTLVAAATGAVAAIGMTASLVLG